MAQEALDRLGDRLRTFDECSDDSVLLSPEAVLDAADTLVGALRESPDDDFLEFRAANLHAVGWFCWHRMVLRGLPVDVHELTIGLFCFFLLGDAVPLPPGAEEGLRKAFGDEPEFHRTVSDLANSLAHTALISTDPRIRESPLAVEGGVLCLRLVLQFRGPEHQEHAHWQSNLGALLLLRAGAGSPDRPDPATLGRAVAAFRAALDHGSTYGIEQGAHLVGLVATLRAWERVTGEPHKDLFVVLPQMLPTIPKDSPLGLALVVQTVGLALATRKFMGFANGDNEEWLQYFERLLRPAIGLLDALGHPLLPDARHCLGTALLLQKKNQSSDEALDEIVDLLTQACRATPVDAFHHGTVLRNLAAAFELLTVSFDGSAKDPDLSILDRQIDVLRPAVDAAPDVDGFVLGLLGDAYLKRSMLATQRSDSDLQDAIALLERALEQGTEDPHLDSLNHHSMVLALSLLRDRSAMDLHLSDRLISLSRQARTLPLLEERPTMHEVLTSALISRHRVTGDSDSLTEAARRLQEADRIFGEDDSRRLAGNRTSALIELWRATGSRVHLDTAVAMQRTAVEESSASTSDGALQRAELAVLLALASSADTGHAQLRQAISLIEELLAGPDRPDDYQTKIRPLLADLLVRGHQAGLPGDLDRTVEIARQAVTATPTDDGLYGRHCGILGLALNLRYHRDGKAADLRDGYTELTRALDSAKLTPSDRINIAGHLGRLAAAGADWHTALSAFRQALGLLPQVASPRGQFQDQQRRLSGRGGLVSAAAACALNVGLPELALELLEQGRGILLARAAVGRAADGTTDLLAAEHPETARRFRDIIEARDAAWHIGPVDVGGGEYTGGQEGAAGHEGAAGGENFGDREDSVDRENTTSSQGSAGREHSDRRHELDRAFDAIVGEIRGLPGHEGFLRPASADQLREAASQGPVAVINVSAYRCDALLVTPTGTSVLPLPDLTEQRCLERFRDLLSALSARDSPDARVQAAASERIRDLLHWLWHTVARPVADALGLTAEDGGEARRLWWCPTGLLSFLPLHAAADRDGDGFLPDLAICSYTPTLGALLQARRKPAPSGPSLVVAVPDAPGATPLPGVRREADTVARLLGGAQVVEGPAATRAEVLRRLDADVNVAHFACHAGADPFDASRSALLLHDGPLTPSEIARLRTGAAGIAYLSACSTAQGVVDLTEEAVHLAGAFHLAGFRHVISTLWPISDEVADEAAGLFYQRLGAADPAEAVTHAVRTLHTKYRRVPTLWAGLLHMGP
ncbi:CHAT domain-containing protein [Streptomyces sp. NPDC055157]